MNYSILLPRRSMLFEEEPEPTVDIEQVLRKDKKSLADVRTAFDYFQPFRYFSPYVQHSLTIQATQDQQLQGVSRGPRYTLFRSRIANIPLICFE